MNVGQLFQRYFNDWSKFALAGLGALLVNLAVGVVATILGFVMLGPALISMFSMEALGVDPDLGGAVAVIGAMGGFLIVALAAGLVALGMSVGGLVGSIAAYRRGEDVGFGTFWSCAIRYLGKMIVLAIIFFLIMLVSALVNIIPILGQIAFFLWMPIAAVTLGIYPAYLIVNDGYSAGNALGQGFQILKSQFGQSVLGGLILLLFLVAFGVVGLVPLLGYLAVTIFGHPLVLFFFIERFEQEVRPRLAA